MKQMTSLKTISQFTLLLAVSVILSLASCKKGADSGSAAPEAAAGGADEAKGKELYMANACNSCHGNTGKGDGPAGAALKPPPRQFADTANYKQGATVEAIAKTLETGVANTPMVSFKHVSEADRLLIAKYVVTLQKQ